MPLPLARGRYALLALSLGLLLAATPVWASRAATRLETAAPPAWQAPVAGIIARIQAAEVYTLVAELSGQRAALIGGTPYTLTTRRTGSGAPLAQATRYITEHLAAAGLAVSVAPWTGCGTAGVNVTGRLTGTVFPGELVLLTAHLDDMPYGALAPGADDNASGVAALLLAARELAPLKLARTVRLVFFTGEEQGLCGSWAYAEAAQAAGENVTAVFNLDMLGWEGDGAPVAELHTRPAGAPAAYAADLAIAGVFTQVVSLYGLDAQLTPVIRADGENASDHASFWDVGFPGVLAIEDSYADFNPYYHTTADTVDRLDLAYLTAFIQASAGTVAHLAAPAHVIYLPLAAR